MLLLPVDGKREREREERVGISFFLFLSPLLPCKFNGYELAGFGTLLVWNILGGEIAFWSDGSKFVGREGFVEDQDASGYLLLRVALNG